MGGEDKDFFLPVPNKFLNIFAQQSLIFFIFSSADETDYEASQPGCAI